MNALALLIADRGAGDERGLAVRDRGRMRRVRRVGKEGVCILE